MLLYILTFLFFGFSSPTDTGNVCLSQSEYSLYEQINEVRRKKGLPLVSVSANLTKVAKLHVADLLDHKPYDSELCNPHSWSDQGVWEACCYRNDHSNAKCMWKKPSEITDYRGDGYEIVAFWQSGEDPTQEIKPETALKLWLESSGHRYVILNESSFSEVEWNAIGIGIYQNYASVWFGIEKDDAPLPQLCSD